jgi:hypothetical protein
VLGPLSDCATQAVLTRRLPAHPGTVTVGAGDRRTGTHDRRALGMCSVPVDHGPPRVAEVPDGGDAGRELDRERGGDDLIEFVVPELGELVQCPGSAVAAEVHVGVDEPREKRSPGYLGDRAVRGCGGRSRFHREDRRPADQYEGSAGDAPLAVECSRSPISVHVGPLCCGGLCPDATQKRPAT